jgi:hypothetical protein
MVVKERNSIPCAHGVSEMHAACAPHSVSSGLIRTQGRKLRFSDPEAELPPGGTALSRRAARAGRQLAHTWPELQGHQKKETGSGTAGSGTCDRFLGKKRPASMQPVTCQHFLKANYKLEIRTWTILESPQRTAKDDRG